MRCPEDEQLLYLLGKQRDSREDLFIFDARSWVAAKANMLNGKGTESMSHYKGCHIEFLDIDNIHKVRDCYK